MQIRLARFGSSNRYLFTAISYAKTGPCVCSDKLRRSDQCENHTSEQFGWFIHVVLLVVLWCLV